ncbi:MAG: putative LacI-family transcriptional regulator [Microbacterium sp.]|jgi:LacI family transcriptional regulator|nr:putative LacI-family transcriptional regulator [Microbacterium sp.]
MSERAKVLGHGPVTLRTLANDLAVSVSTVSRVLRAQSTEEAERWASPETVERIRRSAIERGYRANPIAASLRTSRSGLVGVLVPRLQDFVLATIYEGIEDAATAAGLSTFVTNSFDDPASQAAKSEMMLQRRVDGLIFGDAHLDHSFLDEFAERGVPFVLVSRYAGDHIAITCDDAVGGRLVGEHLLQGGRTRPVVLAGLPFASTAQDRSRGLVEAYANAGHRIDPSHIVYSGFDAAGGRAGMEQVLDSGYLPDAVFATNDFAAIGALGALRDHGLRVPDDVAIVGYNDTPLAAEIAIPLTTVQSPMHELGRTALNTLKRMMNGEEVSSVQLAPTLIARASSRPSPL